MVRSLLRDRRYRATANGDALSIFKCEEIYEYKFLPQINCTKEFPVAFYYKHEVHHGWLSGLSHAIVETPSYTDCPAPPFIFILENISVHLSNKTILANLPILPSPHEGITLHELPDIAFSSPGTYSIEDINGQDTILSLLKQMKKKARIDQILTDKINGYNLTPDQLQFSEALQELALAPIRAFLIKIIVIISTIFSLYVFLQIIHAFRYTLAARFPILTKYKLLRLYFLEKEHSYISIREMQETNFEAKAPFIHHSSPAVDNNDEVDLLHVNNIATYPAQSLAQLRRLQ